jgi:hypothetical protein
MILWLGARGSWFTGNFQNLGLERGDVWSWLGEDDLGLTHGGRESIRFGN